MVWELISKDDFVNRCGLGRNPLLTTISKVMLKSTTTTIRRTTTTKECGQYCSLISFFQISSSEKVVRFYMYGMLLHLNTLHCNEIDLT